MNQINGIGFTNFRVFKDTTFFELSPISVFTGTNSSGKSSVFKGLLLLKDNSKDLDSLIFSGEYHKLGTYDIAKNNSSEREQISFDLSFKSEADYYVINQYKLSLEYASNKDLNIENGSLSALSITADQNSEEDAVIFTANKVQHGYSTFLDVTFLFKEIENNLVPSFDKYVQKMQRQSRRNEGVGAGAGRGAGNLIMRSYNPNDPFNTYDSVLRKLRTYDFSVISSEKLQKVLSEASEENLKKYSEVIKVAALKYLSYEKDMFHFGIASLEGNEINHFSSIFNHHIQRLDGAERIKVKSLSIESDIELPESLYEATLGDICDYKFFLICKELIARELRSILNAVKSGLSNIGHIEAIRANTQRLYTNQSQGTSFNKLLLEVTQHLDISNKDKRAIKFLNKWLQSFGIGDRLTIRRVKGIATEVVIEKDRREIDLVDLGYGVTQFLPILLFTISKLELKFSYSSFSKRPADVSKVIMPNGPLLLIEEPESNLHPKLQSFLADFFIDVAKNFHVTLLIETHSEYLIRRLQVLTAAGEAKSKDSVIYYLDGEVSSDSGRFVKKININPDGSLSNDFGSGFIDEATNWKLELMRLKNAHLYNVN